MARKHCEYTITYGYGRSNNLQQGEFEIKHKELLNEVFIHSTALWNVSFTARYLLITRVFICGTAIPNPRRPPKWIPYRGLIVDHRRVGGPISRDRVGGLGVASRQYFPSLLSLGPGTTPA
ncbi:uncharacterized protein BO96DRAFT_485748 [Aspergillus niger CBS 101883]|uniref:Uncharacterized protein n=2 Tax=Aspergillus niger TaxID=5061 RepID=A2Q8D0_ASPNC|nr:uncharacterized protein BO96DRAFT_485748 [Aspergillus niger CBS 101883]XP_059599599.1 hypothetical protein An01g03910 [Aspergillus niger]PYH51932.1 hypothetical protein BO96DRAFT_485748 [Aspergillus niger CBS 101883]CAK36927.1 hypothetical protein An01g03910 [Aspergillus niger]